METPKFEAAGGLAAAPNRKPARPDGKRKPAERLGAAQRASSDPSMRVRKMHQAADGSVPCDPR